MPSVYAPDEIIAGGDTATPIRCVSVEARLIGFRCIDPLEADLGFADRERVAVDDVSLTGDRFSGLGATND